MIKKMKTLLALACAAFVGQSALAWYPTTNLEQLQADINAGVSSFTLEDDLALFAWDAEGAGFNACIGLNIPYDKNVTIDLNGHTISVANEGRADFKPITVERGGSVMFKNGKITCGVTPTGGYTVAGRVFNFINPTGVDYSALPDAQVLLNDVDVTVVGAAIANAATAHNQFVARNGSTFTFVDGGAMHGSGVYAFTGGLHADLGDSTIYQSMKQGDSLVSAHNSAYGLTEFVGLDDGTFRTTLGVGFKGALGSTKIGRDTMIDLPVGCALQRIDCPEPSSSPYYYNYGVTSLKQPATVTFKGSKLPEAIRPEPVVRNVFVGDKVTLSGDVFTVAGYHVTGWTDEDGNAYELGAEYTVEEDVAFEADWEKDPEPPVDDGVAKILGTGVQYKTIEAAFADAQDGDVIVMLKDAPLSTACAVEKNVTFDLAGKRVGVAENAQFVVKQGCMLTVMTSDKSVIDADKFPISKGRIVPLQKSDDVRPLALVSCEPGSTFTIESGLIGSINDNYEAEKDRGTNLKKLNFSNGAAVKVDGAVVYAKGGTIRGNPAFDVYGAADLQCIGASVTGNPVNTGSYDHAVLPDGKMFFLHADSDAKVVMTKMHADCGGYLIYSEAGAAGTVNIDDARIESRNTPFYLEGTTRVNFNSGLYRDTNFRENYGNYDLPVSHLVAGSAKNLLIKRGVKGYLANKKGDKPGQVDYFTDIVGTASEVAPGGERKCEPLQLYLAPSEHCVEVAQVFDAEGKAVWPSYSEDQPSYRYNCEIKIMPARIGEVYFDSLPLAVFHHEEYGQSVTINLCRDSFGIGIQAGAPLTIDFSDDWQEGTPRFTYDVRTTCTDVNIPEGVKTGFYTQAGGSGEFVIKNGTLNWDPFTKAETTTLIASRGNFVIEDMTLNAGEYVRTATTLTYIDAVVTIKGTTSVNGEALVAVGQAADGQELFFDNTIAIEPDALTFDNLAAFDCTKTLVERRKDLALDPPAGYYWAQSAKGDDIEVLAKIGVIQVPKAIEGLVYNGEEQVGVPYGEGYYLTNEKATDAGEGYEAQANLSDPDHTTWSDESIEEKTITWSIAKAPVTVKADDKTKAAGTQDPELTYTVTPGQLFGNDTFKLTKISREPGEAAGEYAITVEGEIVQGEGKDNYTLSFEAGTLTITGKIVPVIADHERPVAHWLIEGKTLADSTLTGGVARVNGEPIEGTFAWEDETIRPADEQDGVIEEFTVVFTPADTEKYATATCKVAVSVDTLPDLSEEGYTTEDNVKFVLASAGRGTVLNVASTDEYAAFREWVLGLGSGAEAKRANKNAQYAYLSFALDQKTLITSDILAQNKLHVKACGVIESIVEEQQIRAGTITVEFVGKTEEVDPIKVGEGASMERVAKAYGAIGTFSLENGWTPSASCSVSEFARTDDGDIQYHVIPQQVGEMAKQYFFAAQLYPDCDRTEVEK